MAVVPMCIARSLYPTSSSPCKLQGRQWAQYNRRKWRGISKARLVPAWPFLSVEQYKVPLVGWMSMRIFQVMPEQLISKEFGNLRRRGSLCSIG